MSSGENGQADGTGRVLAGRYRVVERLGRGGMGVVWRAVDEVLGREVAVKELRTFTDTAGPELDALRLRMQREARAAARVRHAGVIAVHDVAEVDGRPLIVMELVDGPSLEDVLRERGPLDPREAASIGAKVMDALAAAHRAGVLHRDVKPGNILLDRSGRVVLTDFGIATMEDPGDDSATHLTRSGQLVGSLDYLAPERAQGGDPGPASDIWALGATLYAAVEGSAPFRRTSTWSTLTAIVVEPLPAPQRAGPLGPVLGQLMDKHPEARPDADRARELLETVAGAPSTDTLTMGLRETGPGPRETTEQSLPSVPPGFGPPQSGPNSGFGPPKSGANSGFRPPPTDGNAGLGPSQPGGPAGAGAPQPGGGAGFGAPHPAGSPEFGVPGPGDPSSAATASTPVVPAPGRRKGRALLAAAAVTVVLAATGVTVALLNGSDGSETGARASTDRSSSATPTDTASQGSADPSQDLDTHTEQGSKKPPAPDAKPSRQTEAAPEASASASKPADGGTTGGGSGDVGGSNGGGQEPSPAPVCDAIGGGKYNCQVWTTAKSYTASGTEVGVLNQGTNYFYCQQNLGRRETYGEWTNVWWAKTDDDSGNTNVFVSDVYIKGGDNNEPVPGLPVC
ncbi:serine/threonine-protein kinase [Streptomyces acidicola]|uniref:non-specific serine/threonine protein kinase n=1 Tax=Streptomyces acidicola TaxID=2596892 RepID=A0A5N8WW34_9ACTN|nr:protein kinase [Streptomyces acidicola]MPY50874.1 protein kinase [Streptomyces acidicola]